MTQKDSLFDLSGKTIVVTGAGSGLGQSMAVAYSEAGATVVIADLAVERACETHELIRAKGGRSLPLAVDVSSLSSVQNMFEEVGENFQILDVLVNNAGFAVPGVRTHEINEADWLNIIQTNLTGTFYCSKEAIPFMLSNGSGSIINISSISGLVGVYPGFSMLTSAYAASKSGMIGLTRQMSNEYAEDNVRVNAIAPGWVGGTKLSEKIKDKMTAVQVQGFENVITAGTPMKRRGRSDEIQGLAVYLASDASEFMTGQVIALDGGWTSC